MTDSVKTTRQLFATNLRLLSHLLLLLLHLQLLILTTTVFATAAHSIANEMDTNHKPSNDEPSSRTTTTKEVNDILPYLDACPGFRQDIYEHFCNEPSASCLNRCGQSMAENMLCACDEMCRMYKDCCYDYREHCPSQAIEGLSIPLEAFDDIKVTCWNGRYVISAKENNHDAELENNDLRDPLVSHGKYLHFINTASYKSIRDEPNQMMRRRQSFSDVIEWERSIYIHEPQSISLDELQHFINTGRMSSLGTKRHRADITVIDHPPEGIVERPCPKSYRYRVVCNEGLTSKSCSSPKTVTFKIPEILNCSGQNVNSLYNNTNYTNNKTNSNDNEDTNSNRNILDNKDPPNMLKREIMTESTKGNCLSTNKNACLIPNILNRQVNVEDRSVVSASDGISLTTPDNAQYFKLSPHQYHSVSHDNNRQTTSTTKTTNGLTESSFTLKSSKTSNLNPRGLSIQFPDNAHFVNKNSKRIPFSELPLSSETTQSNDIRNHVPTASNKLNDHRDDNNTKIKDKCRVEQIHPEFKSVQRIPPSNVPFINVAFQNQKSGAMAKIFIGNTNSSIERLVCKRSDHPFESEPCNLSVTCRPGLIPMGLRCAQPSKLIVETYGSRNLSLQRTAIFAILSSLISNFSDTFFVPTNWFSEMSLNLYSIPHAASLRNVLPMSRSSSLRYDTNSLPMRQNIQETIQTHYLGHTNQPQQQLSIRCVTACLVVEKLSNFSDWLVCDRWYFDIYNNVNCTEHFHLQGNVMPPVAKQITSKKCLTNPPNTFEYSGSPYESHKKIELFLILWLIIYMFFKLSL